jgi:hypothetical protein
MSVDTVPDSTELTPDPTKDRPAKDWSEELTTELPPISVRPLRPGYHFYHYAGVGLWQGALAGCVSLVFNVIGSALWPAISGTDQHPLRLIQVFLTFPLGESALELNSGVLLALGCLMYLATGMIYGMLFVVALSYLMPNASVGGRLVACSVLAMVVWTLNFYLLLSWLQPWLIGGRWISELVPWWVAASTHLVFGWTIALIYPLASQTVSDSTEDFSV